MRTGSGAGSSSVFESIGALFVSAGQEVIPRKLISSRHVDADSGSTTPSDMLGAPPSDPVEAARAMAALERSLFGHDSAAKVGRFVVLDPLGRGGMGIVYAAWDPELQRRIAIKLLRPGASSEKRKSRLLSEARAAARLAHPNVVAIHDVGEAEGQIFIAMEYVEGPTLAEYAAADVGLDTCLDLFSQAGRGLAAAHRAGLVHRDFKPANVLVSTDEREGLRARVADFGLARAEAVAAPLAVTIDAANTGVTTTAGSAGTPAYMSPEQLRGEALDPRTDQFSFCVALYEAIYGVRPFAAKTATARLERILEARWNPPTGLRINKRLARAIERGLQPAPDARHPDMDALLLAMAPHTRRRWVLSTAALASVGLAATFALSDAPEVEPCQDLGLVWTQSVAPQVDAAVTALEAAKVPSGARQAASTRSLLETYGERWIETRTDICEATHARGEQSAALMEIRMACLDRLRVQTEVVLSRLTQGDVGALRSAVDVASQLAPPRDCSALDADGGSAPPADPEVRRRYDATVLKIAESEADFAFGRWKEGRGRTADALSQLEGADLEHERAGVLALQAAFEARIGDPKQARETAEEALALAVSAGQTATAASIANNLMWIEGKVLGKYDLADRSGELALAWQAAGATSPGQRAVTLDAMGINAFARNDFALAESRHREALAMVSQEATRIRIMLNLAAALKGNRQRAKSAEAEATLDEALRRAEILYGEESAMVAAILHNTAAFAPTEIACSRARPLLERALAIKEKSYGPRALALASTLGSLAECDLDEGQPQVAVQRRNRALELLEEKLGPDNPRLLIPLEGLAYAQASAAQLEAAESVLDRAERLLAQHHGKDHEYAYGLIRVRATIAGARGDFAEERRLLAESIARARIAEPGSFAVPIIRLQRARAWAASGHIEEAKLAAREVLGSLGNEEHYEGVLREQAQELLRAPD